MLRTITLFRKAIKLDGKPQFYSYFASYTSKNGEQKTIKVKLPSSSLLSSSPTFSAKLLEMSNSNDFPLSVTLEDGKDYYVGAEKKQGKIVLDKNGNKYPLMIILNVQSYAKADLEYSTLD